MSPKQKKATVVLGISKITVPQLIANTRHYVTSMTGNTHFPAPSPALPTITTQVDLVESDYTVSLTRVKGSASKMHAEVKILIVNLKALAGYVESIANADADHASDIISSAGMNQRKPAVRTPKTFTAVAGKLKGTVTLNTKAVPRSAYIYQMSADPTNVANWATIYTGTMVKFIKTGLTSATHYYFRVAVVTKGVQGNWSDAVESLIL